MSSDAGDVSARKTNARTVSSPGTCVTNSSPPGLAFVSTLPAGFSSFGVEPSTSPNRGLTFQNCVAREYLPKCHRLNGAGKSIWH